MSRILFLALIFTLPLFGEIKKEYNVVPLKEFTQRVQVSGIESTFSIDNRLGNIEVYELRGDQIVVTGDGLQFTQNTGRLRIWEVTPNNFSIRIVYPAIHQQYTKAIYESALANGNPALGIIKKGDTIILGGRMAIRNNVLSIGPNATVGVQGSVGQVNIKVGIPSIKNLKVSTMTGDILIRDLVGNGDERAVWAQSSAGAVEILNTKARDGFYIPKGTVGKEKTCGKVLTEDPKEKITSRFTYDETKWDAN